MASSVENFFSTLIKNATKELTQEVLPVLKETILDSVEKLPYEFKQLKYAFRNNLSVDLKNNKLALNNVPVETFFKFLIHGEVVGAFALLGDPFLSGVVNVPFVKNKLNAEIKTWPAHHLVVLRKNAFQIEKLIPEFGKDLTKDDLKDLKQQNNKHVKKILNVLNENKGKFALIDAGTAGGMYTLESISNVQKALNGCIVSYNANNQIKFCKDVDLTCNTEAKNITSDILPKCNFDHPYPENIKICSEFTDNSKLCDSNCSNDKIFKDSTQNLNKIVYSCKQATMAEATAALFHHDFDNIMQSINKKSVFNVGKYGFYIFIAVFFIIVSFFIIKFF